MIAPVRTHLALLLHMHQPWYVDPASGTALLPWVRLHGGRAYLDVASLLHEFGEVRLTVNFVPSLVEQLVAVAGGARDAWEEIAVRPTGSWTPEERTFLVERFFSIAWNPNVESRPRYRELLEKRGRSVGPEALPERAAAFTDAELRDLTVLFHLAWLGFAVRAVEPALAELEKKGRNYDESDLGVVLAAGRAACARVLTLYRSLAERGQIELSSSPYFHPIVPLVCDTESARRAASHLPLPERFAFPGDGRRQIAAGREAHARTFGRPATGMWPPEGSISPEAVAAYREEGVGWLASDEGNLFRSLPAPIAAPAPDRGLLYRAFRFDGVDLVFRDRDISDRIGFRYAHGEAPEAVEDLVSRVRGAGVAGRDAGSKAPLVSVILDGENPWEHYPGSGEPFLRTLFAELSERRREGEIIPVGIGPYLAEHPEREELTRLHSGSWIDSDFHIWIGDPVKNRAWDLLGHARRRLQRALETAASSGASGSERDGRIAAARRHLDAAEGSDWFWWFGEPFHSAEDALFDRLFRAQLAAAWRSLGELPPSELDEPGARRAAAPLVRFPRARISPSIDGCVGSYFEWIGAGRYDVPRGAAMAEAPPIETVHFGFDDDSFYLRLDPTAGVAPRLRAAATELTVRLGERELRFLAEPAATGFRPTPGGTAPGANPPVAAEDAEASKPLGRLACGEVLELSFPFAAIGAVPGDRFEVALRLHEPGAVLIRIPRDGRLELRVPDASFDAEHWLL